MRVNSFLHPSCFGFLFLRSLFTGTRLQQQLPTSPKGNPLWRRGQPGVRRTLKQASKYHETGDK